jgi:hypothetical protein
MENLTIEETKSTPSISFDAQRGTLEIRGRSYPENAAKFYTPIFEWIRSYLASTNQDIVEVTLEINYLNSSSSKALLNLLDILDAFAKDGRKVIINWLYHEEDETALECGEEFKEDLEWASFNLVQIAQE